MEPQEFDFSPKRAKLGRDMQATMDGLHAALQKKWERDKRESQTVYEVSIPAQTLTIFGKEHAEHTLHVLKSLKVSGTYRVTKK